MQLKRTLEWRPRSATHEVQEVDECGVVLPTCRTWYGVQVEVCTCTDGKFVKQIYGGLYLSEGKKTHAYCGAGG